MYVLNMLTKSNRFSAIAVDVVDQRKNKIYLPTVRVLFIVVLTPDYFILLPNQPNTWSVILAYLETIFVSLILFCIQNNKHFLSLKAFSLEREREEANYGFCETKRKKKKKNSRRTSTATSNQFSSVFGE